MARNFISQLENNSVFQDIKNLEKKGKAELYSDAEISRQLKLDADFDDKILDEQLSDYLLKLAGSIDNPNDLKTLLSVLNKYSGKINTRYLYNVRGKRLLDQLQTAGISRDYYAEMSQIFSDASVKLSELGDDLGNLWHTGLDFIDNQYEEIENTLQGFQEASRKERLKMIYELSAASAYESLEPSKKVKILGMFLPDNFIRFISRSTSNFRVNGNELNPGDIIDNFMGLLEDAQGILDFFEIDTQKIVQFDIEKDADVG